MKRVSQLRQHRTTLLAIFSFLLGWMMATNLASIDRTCRIEDSDREYNIMKNSKLKSPELIVLILSAPKNVDLRNTVRKTWLKLHNYDNKIEQRVKFKMKHYFVVGTLGLHTDEMSRISAEQSTHNDILLLPIYDSYTNLTNKVRKSFEWLNEQYDYGLTFKYVLKCDDDTFIRLDNLLSELQSVELFYLKADLKHTLDLVKDESSPFIRINVQTNDKTTSRNNLQLYWGYFSGSARIKANGKYKEAEWMLCDRYVPYALGGGYILSKNLVSVIARNSDTLRHVKYPKAPNRRSILLCNRNCTIFCL